MRVAEQQAAVRAAGLLDKKESEDSNAVIGPSMPEHEPPHTEVHLKHIQFLNIQIECYFETIQNFLCFFPLLLCELPALGSCTAFLLD